MRLPEFLTTDPFEQVIGGNRVTAWLVAVGLAIGLFALLFLVRRLLAGRLEAMASRTETTLDDLIADLFGRTRPFFLLAMAVLAASETLVLRPRWEVWLHRGLVITFVVQGALWGNALIAYWLEQWLARGKTGAAQSGALNALGVAVRMALFAVLLLVALDNLGINITALVTGLGITGIAVALAVQNVLGDLLGALSIVIDKPFEVGDAIQVDAFEGTVERIGLKTTRVRSVDGEELVFANADLLRSKIRNLARRSTRRVVLVHTLTPDTSADVLAQLPARVMAVVQAQPSTQFDRAVWRAATPEGLEFETVYTLDSSDFPLHVDTRSRVLLGLHGVLRELGIEYATSDQTGAARALRRRERPSVTPQL